MGRVVEEVIGEPVGWSDSRGRSRVRWKDGVGVGRRSGRADSGHDGSRKNNNEAHGTLHKDGGWCLVLGVWDELGPSGAQALVLLELCDRVPRGGDGRAW